MARMHWNRTKRPGIVISGGRPGLNFTTKAAHACKRKFLAMTEQEVKMFRVHNKIAKRNAAMRGKVSLAKLPWEGRE